MEKKYVLCEVEESLHKEIRIKAATECLKIKDVVSDLLKKALRKA